MNLFNQPEFNGSDYISEVDRVRLTGQIKRIFDCMKDSRFRTLGEIEAITGDGQSSISAQLRNMRKERFGLHTVLKCRRHDAGLFEYQLIENKSTRGHTP